MTEEKDLSQDPKVQKITEELQDYYDESAPDESSASDKSSLHAINEHLNQYYQATLSGTEETEDKPSRIESILGTSQPERIEAAMSHPIEKFMSIPQEPKQPEDPSPKSEIDQVLDNLFIKEGEESKPEVEAPEKGAEPPSPLHEAAITDEEGDYLAKMKPHEGAPSEETAAIAPEEEEEISTYLTSLFGEKPSEEEAPVPHLTPPTEPGPHFVETPPEKAEEELFMEEKEEEKIVMAAAREAEAVEAAKVAPEEAAAPAEGIEEQDPLQLGMIKASLNHQAEINASLVPINNYMMGVLSELDKKVGNVRDYFSARRTLEEMYQHLQQLPKNASIQEVLKIAEELVSSKGKIATSAAAAEQELAEAENVARLMKETAEQFLKSVQKTKEQIDKDTLA